MGRTSSHRQALLRNMLGSLFLYEAIGTTLAKAKELARSADKMITLAKQGSLTARRRISALIHQPQAVKKLYQSIIPRFAEKNSGYTRIIKKGFRRGDNAPLALIELIGREVKKPKKKTKEKSPSRRSKKAEEKPAPKKGKRAEEKLPSRRARKAGDK